MSETFQTRFQKSRNSQRNTGFVENPVDWWCGGSSSSSSLVLVLGNQVGIEDEGRGRRTSTMAGRSSQRASQSRVAAAATGSAGNEPAQNLGRLILALAAFVLLCLAAADTARADDIRPAYLDVEELYSGALHVVWKVPLGQNLPVRFAPVFPESFRAVPPRERVKTSTAVTESWTMVCSAEGLEGAVIGIEGLEETAMDALVRIQLRDGSVHRTVLRPTDRFMTVPSTGSTTGQHEGGQGWMLRGVGHWRYALLFLIAWGLSLTPAARQRGILLCALALVAGSLCGHALGRLPVRETLSRDSMPSDTEAKRILSGLMLNTYRAFMLEDDEEIYDVLARSVAGEFLSEIYLQNREAMRMDSEDAALSLVNRLDVKAVESLKRVEGGAISMIADWDVYGLVYHWDHVHFRCNTYRAELTIVPMDGYWKLTRLQLLDEERVI